MIRSDLVPNIETTPLPHDHWFCLAYNINSPIFKVVPFAVQKFKRSAASLELEISALNADGELWEIGDEPR